MLNGGGMAAAQGAGKLAARAEGRGSRASSWRAPLAGAVMDTSGLEELTEPDAAVPLSLPPGQELGWDILRSLYPEDEFDAESIDLESLDVN